MKKPFAVLALSLVVMLCVLPATSVLAEIPPRPENATGYVFDYTADSVMEADDLADMNAYAADLERKTGAQAVTVLVDFLDGEDVDLYAHDLFNAWGIGQKQKNNGALLLFALGSRDIYIYPGTGLERTLSGSVSGKILDDYALPELRNNNYSAGVHDAFTAICDRIAQADGVKLAATARGSRNAQGYRSSDGGRDDEQDREESGGWFGTLIVILIVWFIIKNLSRRRAYASGGGSGCLPFLLGGFLGGMFRGGYGGYNGPRMPPMGGWGNWGGGSSRGGGGGGFRPGGGSGRGGGAGRKF